MNHRLSMTLLGLGLAAAIVPHAVAPKALSSAPVVSRCSQSCAAALAM